MPKNEWCRKKHWNKWRTYPEEKIGIHDVAVATDFLPKYTRKSADIMAAALNAYAAMGFIWTRVLKAKVCSQAGLNSFLKRPEFLAKIEELAPVALSRAIDTYFSALDEAPWPERIKAADRITQFYDHRWDPGVRRAKVTQAGNAANALLQMAIDERRKILARVPIRIEDGRKEEQEDSIPKVEQGEEVEGEYGSRADL